MKASIVIGFWEKDVETKPGVYKPKIIEKRYTGDVLRNTRRFQDAENQQNSNLKISNRLSIISDLFMQQNWPSVKYVIWNGVKWSANSVDVGSYPRVIIELGGVYNGTNAPA